MTTFRGFGPGKRTGRGRVTLVLRDGELVEDQPRPRVKKPAVHTRFNPFTTHQVARKVADKLGIPRTGSAVHFTNEAQLNRYQAFERAAGRMAEWKTHDASETERPD